MKSKYKCPFCQYMSLKKWNIKKHVNNVHGIRNYPNGSIQRANKNNQNMRQPEFCTKCECPNHSSEYRSIQQHKQTFDDEQKSRNGLNQFQGHHVTYDGTISRDEIIQEKHPPLMKTISCCQLQPNEYAQRFVDASTQYSNHDMSYSQISHDATKSRDENCKKRKPTVINSKGVFILE